MGKGTTKAKEKRHNSDEQRTMESKKKRPRGRMQLN
jgi:hypothetical protein